MLEQIKTIIEGMGLSYFRAINPKDLNEQAIKSSMTNIGVLAGLIEIDATLDDTSNRSIEEWDLNIMFLTLAPQMDATGEQIDTLLDTLYAHAHTFIAEIQEILPSGYYLDSYELNATDSVNITSEVLIGWELKITIPVIVNICPPQN